MDVVKEIIQNSAIGPLPMGYKRLVLSLFVSIVCTLFFMLTLLLINGATANFHYGY
ncbi:hypothetical protein [Flagellimonas olearia]|uniref:hypothetical protein n=1 Tax=Flagellimonas olearia TaxID=552546 RepID=UPI0013EA86A1|nr:hypothetical protein [Allomuricauda olearia]